LLDRAQVDPWFDLVAARRSGQQHARQPRLDDRRQQWRWDVLIPLDLVSGFGDQWADLPRPRDGIEASRCGADIIHERGPCWSDGWITASRRGFCQTEEAGMEGYRDLREPLYKRLLHDPRR